jgi:hypothetical protein
MDIKSLVNELFNSFKSLDIVIICIILYLKTNENDTTYVYWTHILNDVTI